MNDFHYIGFDVHKKKIHYCVKQADGKVVEQNQIESRRHQLEAFARQRRQPWKGVMEATLFSYWIYDVLAPYAAELSIAHPAMVKAIAAGKHKNDKLDAEKLSDLVRCNWVPKCWVPPAWVRDLRRALRWRMDLQRQAVQTMNRIGATLMETGVVYEARRLHGKKYFGELMAELREAPGEVRSVLQDQRKLLEAIQAMERKIVRELERHPRLKLRLELLESIPAVGPMMALTWALEVGDPLRLGSIRKALSYCGLVTADNRSAEREGAGPLSKKRNPYLQTMLIEVARLGPQYNPLLAAVYDKERDRGASDKCATVAVARKLVAYLLAVDKSGQRWQPPAGAPTAESAAEAEKDPTAQSSPAGTGAFFPPQPPVAEAMESAVPQRCSPARVRSAAPEAGAPLPAVRRCGGGEAATGGSGGKKARA